MYIFNQGFDAVIQHRKTIESDLLCLSIGCLIEVPTSGVSNTKDSGYLQFRLKNEKKIGLYPYIKYISEIN